MSARAHVEFDPMRFGVRLAVQLASGENESTCIIWPGPPVAKVVRAGEDDPNVWLPLSEDVARAIYEALGDHFGHSGHDARALRKDYDAERARVDAFIKHLTGGVR